MINVKKSFQRLPERYGFMFKWKELFHFLSFNERVYQTDI
jgi:hypothetical protein